MPAPPTLPPGPRARSHFLILLLSLLGLLALHPLLPADVHARSVLHVDVAFLLVLLGSIWTLSRRKTVLAASLVLVSPAIVATLLVHFSSNRSLVLLGLVCSLAFILLTMGAVLWRVLRVPDVDTHTILGALCAYLLLGIAWALVYSILEYVQPGAFAKAGTPLTGVGATGLLAPEILNYSILVLSTVGPQDLQPLSRPALAWTGLEAMSGQLYLAVLIGRLVGQHASSRAAPR